MKVADAMSVEVEVGVGIDRQLQADDNVALGAYELRTAGFGFGGGAARFTEAPVMQLPPSTVCVANTTVDVEIVEVPASVEVVVKVVAVLVEVVVTVLTIRQSKRVRIQIYRYSRRGRDIRALHRYRAGAYGCGCRRGETTKCHKPVVQTTHELPILLRSVGRGDLGDNSRNREIAGAKRRSLRCSAGKGYNFLHRWACNCRRTECQILCWRCNSLAKEESKEYSSHFLVIHNCEDTDFAMLIMIFKPEARGDGSLISPFM